MLNPSIAIDVALVGVTPLSGTNCDPAFDANAPGAAAKFSAYERERTPEALAALPRKPDARPALFRLQPLTGAGVRVLNEGTPSPARRAQIAVQIACHFFVDADGGEHKVADHGGTQPLGKLALAGDEWIDHIADLYGEKAIAELASVVIQRREAGPGALAPFALPPGLMLPR